MMDESKPSLIDNIKYEITSETTCKVVGYKGWLVKVIIPDEVTIEGKQYRVTVIGKDSFSCSNLTSIELPSGITEIEDQAFMGCTYLESVNLPYGLDAMGDSVFIYCKFIETVEIPDSVKKLGESVFYGCEKLKKVKLPSSLTTISNTFFYECKSLESIEISDAVKTIADYAFYGCEKLSTVNLPFGLESLGEGAFKGCLSLKYIELPQTLTRIGDMAFTDCPLSEEVKLPDSFVSEEINYGFSEDVSKVVIDDSDNSTESEFQYNSEDEMFINPFEIESNIINILSYKGELVKIFSDKIVIGEKVLPAENENRYYCENDVLTYTDSENFYVYDGEKFVLTECKYKNHNDYFSPEIYCSILTDTQNSIQHIALNDHGKEYSFEYKFKSPLSEYYYFAKSGVLFFMETFIPKLRFFSKTGEELWSLELIKGDRFKESFFYDIDTANIDLESDGIIIKIQKGDNIYTVCFNVPNGEVNWYRKDNHPFLFTGAKCNDGLMRGVFHCKDNGELVTVMFEINPSNGKAHTYCISDNDKARKITVSDFGTELERYKYILDGEILYAISKNEIIVVDINKKVILSRKKAPANAEYYQNSAILNDGKLYVCLQYALMDAADVMKKIAEYSQTAIASNNVDMTMMSMLMDYSSHVNDKQEIWKCYYLSDTPIVEENIFDELSEIEKLQVLTGCECEDFDGSVENYFKYREKGKEDGYIPVLVDTDDIFFEQLEALLKCNGESSISKIQEIVEEYHEKMLAMPVEDGKAYLEKNHIEAEWDESELENDDYEAEERFTKGGYIVKVPVTEPWRIWAYLPYGGWNACPKVSEHMAVSKYWYEQYGAYPAALSYDTIDYAVENPVEDLEKLANEIGTYCFDIVEQGCETYSALALELKDSRIWNLWWD